MRQGLLVCQALPRQLGWQVLLKALPMVPEQPSMPAKRREERGLPVLCHSAQKVWMKVL